MKKNRFKKSILFLALVATGVWFWNSFNHSQLGPTVTQLDESSSPSQRSPASSRPSKAASTAKSNVQDHQSDKKIQLHVSKLEPINEIAQDWKQKFLDRLQQQAGDEVKIEVLQIVPKIYEKHGTALHAHKVKIKLTRPDGLTSSFTALVNSTTGMVIQTWNRTQYELQSQIFKPIEAVPLIAHQNDEETED